jgi:hypothetical protein
VVKDHYFLVAKKRKAKAKDFWGIMPPKAKKIVPITSAAKPSAKKKSA